MYYFKPSNYQFFLIFELLVVVISDLNITTFFYLVDSIFVRAFRDLNTYIRRVFYLHTVNWLLDSVNNLD